MPVFAYRGEIKVIAEIVHVFKHDAKLNWANDSSLSTFCVPYNQIRPMKVDDELEGADIAKEGYLKKTNTGSMFPPYVGCAVLVLYSTINHPAKIIRVHRNEAEVHYDLCGSVSQVPYRRMIPVLDNDIPLANQRKHNTIPLYPKLWQFKARVPTR